MQPILRIIATWSAALIALSLLLGAGPPDRRDEGRAEDSVGALSDAELIRLASRSFGHHTLDDLILYDVGVPFPPDASHGAQVEFELWRRFRAAPAPFAPPERRLLSEVLVRSIETTMHAQDPLSFVACAMLTEHWSRGILSADQYRRVASASISIDWNLESEWPDGSVASARPHVTVPLRVGTIRLTLRDAETSALVDRIELRPLVIGPMRHGDGPPMLCIDDTDDWVSCGVVEAASAPRTIDVQLERRDGSAWVPLEMRTLPAPRPLSAPPPAKIAGRADTELAHALADVRYGNCPEYTPGPRAHPDRPLVALNHDAIAEAMTAAGIDRLGLRFELRRDDRLIATRTGCWLHRDRQPTSRIRPLPCAIGLEFTNAVKDPEMFRPMVGDVLIVTSDPDAAWRMRPVGAFWDGTAQRVINADRLITCDTIEDEAFWR